MSEESMRERIARTIGVGIDIVDPLVGDVIEENDLLAAADAVLAAIEAAGMVVVPREPTEAMIEAEEIWFPPDAAFEGGDAKYPDVIKGNWQAMIDAALEDKGRG